ncbi:hypothetical protein SJAG_05258 [Schizosaccharomyces japonicus yFS275]|uniref:Uncharacterized protein n=1 Tax=Schizosaccharomyces japonicus (strain yFS275 / FY16936) TaxID=402676 RepID=B6K1U4_SCHJY|nr:hypothetical protein SJAG_05258 [Schizosaccharomyces japonicus yFS275]EEB07125.1 hypothetical protein SJAG_05258 [Schizosaccharomyces japonicus yFS275]
MFVRNLFQLRSLGKLAHQVNLLDVFEDDKVASQSLEAFNGPSWPAVSETGVALPVPVTPTQVLQHIIEYEFTEPSNFFQSLSKLSFPLKQSVLNHKITEQYALGLLYASQIAQRVLYGRKRKNDLASVLTDRLYLSWKAFLPRLRILCLKNPDLPIRNLDTTPLEPLSITPAPTTCHVCGLDENERVPEILVEDLFVWEGSIAWHEHCKKMYDHLLADGTLKTS